MSTFSITDHKDSPQPAYCQITTSKGIYNIPLDDIFFIECHQKKSFVHTKAGILILPVPLYRLKDALPASLFQQTHRSFLVNLKNISHIDKQKDPWTISFFGCKEHAFISRSFRHHFRKAVRD